MSRAQIRVVIGLLVVVHLVADLVLVPVGQAVSSNDVLVRVGLITMGALMAQPALLAVWAALAPSPLSRRLGHALLLLACLCLAVDFASVQNSLSYEQQGEVLGFILWLVAFFVCQLPLWLLRGRFGWQLQAPHDALGEPRQPSNQFSLRKLLGSMALIAAFLAAVRWLHPVTEPMDEWPLAVLRFAAMGAVMSLLGMLALIACWLILLPGRQGRWRWFLGIGSSCAVAATTTAVAMYGSPGEVGELIFIVLGLLLTAACSIYVVRLCGYCLVRQPAAERTDRDAAPHLEPTKCSFRRFTLVTSAMLLVLAGLTALAPARLRLWSELAEQRRWRDAGIQLFSANGEVLHVQTLEGVQSLEIGLIDRIGQFRRLRRLDLSSSTADDETLERLPGLAELTKLSLFCTRISDEGLAHLSKFRNLQWLNLQMSEISDEGLDHLAGLTELRSVDLRHTRVTPEGARRLKLARPDLTIQATADDASLAQIAAHFRPRRTRLSRSAVPSTAMVRLHANGSQVTDAGITALRGMTQLEALDLRGASVTDAATSDLATLTGLKRLVLEGTQVTEAGVAKLRKALPNCEIRP